VNEDYAIQLAVQQIAPAEVFTSNAYWDVNGYAIGYGFHYYSNGSAVERGDTMTKADADTYVYTVARQKWNAIKPCITVDINENQAAALIDLAYNCGEGTVCRSTLLSLINSGAPVDDISAEFEQTCTTAGGKYLNVLYRRRVNEVQLFWSNVTQYAKLNPQVILIGGIFIVGLFGFLLYRSVYKGH
jgi:lysozyme